MTCAEMSWPTRPAAAAPASTAARTAATSPPNITVTSPASARSLPSKRTSAAFRPASAASTAPTSPFVSTSPRACSDQVTSAVVRAALRQDRLDVRVRARNHMDGHELADALGCCRAGIGGGLHRTDVAAHHDGHVPAADLLLPDQPDVGGLDHRVRCFD